MLVTSLHLNCINTFCLYQGSLREFDPTAHDQIMEDVANHVSTSLAKNIILNIRDVVDFYQVSQLDITSSLVQLFNPRVIAMACNTAVQ